MDLISTKQGCPPATTDLWNQANDHHQAAERAARSAIEQARQCGDVLIKLKATYVRHTIAETADAAS